MDSSQTEGNIRILFSSSDSIQLYEISNVNHFTYILSIKVKAIYIALCDQYISYSTKNEIFLIGFKFSLLMQKEVFLSDICKSTIESCRNNSQKDQKYFLYDYNLKTIQKMNPDRKSFTKASNSSQAKKSSHFTEFIFDQLGMKNKMPYDLLPLSIPKTLHKASLNPPGSPSNQILGPVFSNHSYNFNQEYGNLETIQLYFYQKLDDNNPIHTLTLSPFKNIRNKIRGTKLFYSTSLQGMLWTIYDEIIQETTTYEYPNMTHAVLTTDTFLFALTKSGFHLYIMKSYDPISLLPIIEKSIHFGVTEYFGLCNVAINPLGHLLVLCKMTENDILQRKNSQLGTTNKSTTFHNVGWNVYSLPFNNFEIILNSFNSWINFKNVTHSETDILIELFCFLSACKNNLNSNWVKQQDQITLSNYLKKILGLFAFLEFKTDNFEKAVELWSLSDVEVNFVLEHLLAKITNTRSDYSRTIIENSFIFYVELMMKINSELLDFKIQKYDDIVFEILKKYPNVLSELILSNTNFSKQNSSKCLDILNQSKSNIEKNSLGRDDFFSDFEIVNSINPIEFNTPKKTENPSLINLAIIFLNSNQSETFQDSLETFSDTFLTTYLSKHPNLLFYHDQNSKIYNYDKPNNFALLLVQKLPWICLEILLKNSSFSTQFSTHILNTHVNKPILLSCYQESKLMKKIIKKAYLVDEETDSEDESLIDDYKTLINIYFENVEYSKVEQILNYNKNDKSIKFNYYQTRPPCSLEMIWKEFHKEFMIDKRFKFLNYMEPFILEKDSNINRFYYKKLQGLVCFLVQNHKLLKNDFSVLFQHVIEKSSSMPDSLSNSLNFLSKVFLRDFNHTLSEFIKKYPNLTTKFVKNYLRSQKDWKLVLDVILEELVLSNSNFDQLNSLRQYLELSAMKLSTSQFLSLLPPNGNSSFFIPYIELNLTQNLSFKILKELQ